MPVTILAVVYGSLHGGSHLSKQWIGLEFLNLVFSITSYLPSTSVTIKSSSQRWP